MASTDARPVCRKGVAWRLYFGLRTSTGVLYTSWASQDSEVSLDGGSFTDCTNEATEIGTSGCGYLDLTSSETNADCVVLKVTTTGGLPLVVTIFPEEAGDYRADVTHFGGTAGTFSSGRPEVNTTHWGGTAIASAVVNANAVQISGDAVAADNLESAADGTGYNLGGGAIVAASVTGAVGSVTGAVGSVTGNLGGNVNGNVSGSVGSVTGAVGSVTGAVGSVTGNVGGSVASVTGAVGSVTGNLGGDVSGKVLGGGSGTITGDGVRAASVTGAVGSVTGSVGSLVGLVTWNPDWDAEVQSECADAIVAADLPRAGVTHRYTQVAANSGAKTADVSIGAAS